ncbi:nuclear transport factor 2 family protein [Acidocella aminolytica]|uniref:SnoaL-like domain-containing protein n=1 Tax=Acidocella aminolytica 101 = DSM 11237 TaxID=1120923 RepID=A0A0D6PL73_9PROT|nr:nuclear transport factor 2 family protein [Acidocella aminolytica]GAN81519.1 hypothetical protein Aam_098_011 [Acidocella aminolytica 101 = DSM 11237]GBQ33097.1 ketosteroid isomerase-related protein [Acidocella aminolytica 101 = DSM 11237]SHF56448.1 hypothetical protein SAMN02746095_03715 [Acidocella aminolytica 101 = DSM 11237]
MTRKFNSFPGLLRGALGESLEPGEEIGDLFADDIVFEFPYAPEGVPRRLSGKAGLFNHLTRISPLLEFGEMTLHRVHPSGETFVIEFSCNGRGRRTGVPYDQRYISVIALSDRRIVRYVDYWNPLVLLSALGGAEATRAAFAEDAADA